MFQLAWNYFTMSKSSYFWFCEVLCVICALFSLFDQMVLTFYEFIFALFLLVRALIFFSSRIDHSFLYGYLLTFLLWFYLAMFTSLKMVLISWLEKFMNATNESCRRTNNLDSPTGNHKCVPFRKILRNTVKGWQYKTVIS